MTKIHSHTLPIEADIVDAFCLMQKGFTDQFVYYDKQRACRYMGLGRCIALPTLDEAESELAGPVEQQPVFFSFNRFDAGNPAPTDELFEAFPRLKFMLPEIVLIENERGTLLQVNSLGPVYAGRIERFARQALAAPPRRRMTCRTGWSPTHARHGARPWAPVWRPSRRDAWTRWCCRGGSAWWPSGRSHRRTCW